MSRVWDTSNFGEYEERGNGQSLSLEPEEGTMVERAEWVLMGRYLQGEEAKRRGAYPPVGGRS